VGLRGPGEKQLESDKRQMKSKISALNKLINSVRTHRARHRMRRKQLGVPVVALVGYTNSGKSTLLNSFTLGAGAAGGVFAADMLFATLDPTTRMIRVPGLKNPDLLLTDTVGFIQKLPTNLIAAFRATLEEISEADVLLHVTDISNDAWRKQEASVLTELAKMGLANKPVVTVWNKLDTVPETAQFLRFEAAKRSQTVAMSAKTGDGSEQLLHALEQALSSQMQLLACTLPYEYTPIMSTLHRLSVLETVTYSDSGIYVKGFVPRFLCEQIVTLSQADDDEEKQRAGASVQVDIPTDVQQIDWKALGKGRHSAREKYTFGESEKK
ncbi:P-loop containing nucleoside triphosphate hydrolase protein, partial [Ochromonadaceae sp. CCMP2298]